METKNECMVDCYRPDCCAPGTCVLPCCKDRDAKEENVRLMQAISELFAAMASRSETVAGCAPGCCGPGCCTPESASVAETENPPDRKRAVSCC